MQYGDASWVLAMFAAVKGVAINPPDFDPFRDIEVLVAAITAGDDVVTIASVVAHRWDALQLARGRGHALSLVRERAGVALLQSPGVAVQLVAGGAWVSDQVQFSMSADRSGDPGWTEDRVRCWEC